MRLNRESREGIQEVEEEIYKRTGVSSTRSKQKTRVKVDTSDYAIEGVLSIKCEDGLWKPVVFLSKSLNKTERNYEIHEKEILVVIRGLENWRHLLEDKI